jgi:predicted TIM-barrel fold metal-dependent hydrolase
MVGVKDNEYVAKSVKKYPNMLIGFALVDPQRGREAAEELKRCVTKLGIKGLKLHPAFMHVKICEGYS